jgi:hypothetical protein
MAIKIGAGFFAVILAMGSMGFASAQDNSTMKPTIHNSTRTLTGCLQKSDDEYVLASDGGRIWELTGNSVKLDGEIGHTVTIMGVVSDLAMHGTKVNMKGEMKEQGGYGYMTVTKLTLVSNTCERNS